MTVKTDVHICGFCFDSKYSIDEVVKFSKDKYDIDLSDCEFHARDNIVSDMFKRILVKEGYDFACKFIEEFEQKFGGKIYIIHVVRRHEKKPKVLDSDYVKQSHVWAYWRYHVRCFANRIENKVMGYRKERNDKCRK